MEVKIHASWQHSLAEEFEKPYFKELTGFVRSEYQSKTIYPSPAKIFRAFDLCPIEKVEVVILGQDPYHGLRQANGLCFSVNEGVQNPPSLQNIFLELKNDLGIEPLKSGELERWAKQGVLLLNATLTVRAGQAGSHQHRGWEIFTDAAIQALSEQRDNLVFLLWGRYAQEKGRVINREKHLVLTAAHPSPFSALSGFFGCRHFSKTNEYLRSVGKNPIAW